MGLELATEVLAGATLRLNEIHEHPFLPYGILAEHRTAHKRTFGLEQHPVCP
jgi:hypothetical protein